MLWVIHCLDQPDSADRRASARPAHSAHLRSSELSPVLYGPLFTDDGTAPIGSLIIVEADSRTQVERFAREDAFTTKQVWANVHIHAWRESERSPRRIHRT